jgi:hypothetical protein
MILKRIYIDMARVNSNVGVIDNVILVCLGVSGVK